jgi:hypothetical protein
MPLSGPDQKAAHRIGTSAYRIDDAIMNSHAMRSVSDTSKDQAWSGLRA